MKLILTESQYSGILKQIRNHQERADFLKKTLVSSITQDINDIMSKYGAIKQRGGRFDMEYVIPTEHNRALHIYVDVKMDFVSCSMTYHNSDRYNVIKWKFSDEEGESNFYSKLNSLLEKRLSKQYQEKLFRKESK